MAYKEFVPSIWSDGVLESLNNKSVFKELCNMEYKGLIQGQGSSVKLLEIGNVTVKDYEGTVVFEKLTDASKMLLIDQSKYAAVDVDDVEEVQSNQSLISKLPKKIGEAIANASDLFVAGLYDQAGLSIGSTGTPTSVTSSNVIEMFTNVATLMDEGNVPQEDRVAVIPPWLYQKLVLAGITADTDNSMILNNGKIGERLGFTLYKSNNISHSGTTWYAPMFFVKGFSIAYADQIDKMEAGKHESSFGEYVKALNVYGAKVLYPAGLCTAYFTAGSET